MATCHNVFQGVFQNVFQDVVQEIIGEAFEEVFQEVFHNVFQGVFQNVFQDVFEDTVREVFQAVRISGVISEGRMAGKIPKQKWLISYFWEHFLVPEHQIPIWLAFALW